MSGYSRPTNGGQSYMKALIRSILLEPGKHMNKTNVHLGNRGNKESKNCLFGLPLPMVVITFIGFVVEINLLYWLRKYMAEYCPSNTEEYAKYGFTAWCKMVDGWVDYFEEHQQWDDVAERWVTFGSGVMATWSFDMMFGGFCCRR